MNKILLILFVLVSGLTFAQHDSIPENKVKVGLVLSGGGAKGFAHVGVLKVLEEAGIRVDYIAGTSMGAIVGGLYASGYNANELDSILKVHDFSALIQDKLPREASSFYQKENEEKYAISLPIEKWKVGLPSAISKGQNVFNLFSQLTEHVHEIDDFSKLPIPFFCIATDLETGEEIVLDHGFLPEAIRASGSFPSLLAPVEIDGRILVDGGIVNNYPVIKLKAKGLDYIIGVDVQGKLHKREDLNSVPAILKQIAGYQMYKNVEEKIEMTDVYLRPDILEYNDFSFEKEREIVIKGENIAWEHFEDLKAIADQQSHKSFHNTIKTFDATRNIIIKEIEVNGNKNYTDKYCMDKLKIQKGETISQKKFIEGINALTATGNFKSVYYRFIKVEGGTKIELKLIEDDITTFLKLGVHYDDLYKTGILVNFTKTHVFLKNDFLSADFIIGDNFRYNIDYFLDNGFNWSIGLNTRYNSFSDNIGLSNIPGDIPGETNLKIPVDYKDFTTQFYIQTTFKNMMALRIGIEDKFLNVFTEEVIDDDLERYNLDKSNYINLFAKFKFDSYSTKFFPKRGFYFDVNYLIYGISSNYANNFNSFSQLSGTLGLAYTFFDKLTFHYISESGITIGSNENGVLDYHIGGINENFINTFYSFYGYNVADMTDSAFLKSALTIRYEVFKKNFVSFTGNFARVDSDLWNSGSIFADTRSGYAVGYGLSTILGPIELRYGWTPDNNQDFWNINVGFWF